MPTRTEIIEAGAGAVAALEWGSSNGGIDPSDDQIAEAALSAMLPLIKAELAAEVWALFQKEHRLWRGMASYEAVRVIERYEP